MHICSFPGAQVSTMCPGCLPTFSIKSPKRVLVYASSISSSRRRLEAGARRDPGCVIYRVLLAPRWTC